MPKDTAITSDLTNLQTRKFYPELFFQIAQGSLSDMLDSSSLENRQALLLILCTTL